MTLYRFSAFIFVFLILTTIRAHSQNLEWAKSIGGTLNDRNDCIISDAQGNILVSGTFEDTVDFDQGSGIFNLSSNGLTDIFIQKLDASGNFIWAKSFGGLSNDNVSIITLDPNGAIYITGFFRDIVDFNPGGATYNLMSNGDSDVFILKLNANGNFMWVKSFGGIEYDYGFSVTTDASENVYLTGSFNDTVDFDPGAATYYLSTLGVVNAFVLKLNGNGNFIWAKSIGGAFRTSSKGIAKDALGNLYITGLFQYNVDFDPDTSTFILTSNGGQDVFIQKLDSSGNFIWAKSFGGFTSDRGLSLTIDNSGNVYIIGMYEVKVDFDPGAATFNMTSKGLSDIFIEKLDASGNFVWAKSMGGVSSDEGFSITTDAMGNVYTTGFYKGTADFDPGTSTFNLSSNGNREVFVQMLNGNGSFIWAESFGGISADDGYSIITNDLGYVYVAGAFSDTVDFDPGTSIFNLSSNGIRDAFIIKLSPFLTQSIEQNDLLHSVSIFPNPNQGTVTIDFGDIKDASLKVFGTSGQLVFQKENILGPTYQFELNAPSGFYILELSSQGEKQRYSLVKK